MKFSRAAWALAFAFAVSSAPAPWASLRAEETIPALEADAAPEVIPGAEDEPDDPLPDAKPQPTPQPTETPAPHAEPGSPTEPAAAPPEETSPAASPTPVATPAAPTLTRDLEVPVESIPLRESDGEPAAPADGVAYPVAEIQPELRPISRFVDLELGVRFYDSSSWNGFTGLNTSAAWDRAPTSKKSTTMTELRAAFAPWLKRWGTWGGNLTLSLPKSVKNDGRPQGVGADVEKETSVWGLRLGPSARIYLGGEETSEQRVFFDTGLEIGQFFANQKHSGASAGELSASAWSLAARIAGGYEMRMKEDLGLYATLGFSFARSSYFSASSGSGIYSDFTSGSRIQVATPAGNESLRLNASGFEIRAGVRFGIK